MTTQTVQYTCDTCHNVYTAPIDNTNGLSAPRIICHNVLTRSTIGAAEPAAPVITSVSPNNGTGTVFLTINGSGFTGITYVRLQNRALTALNITDTQITGNTPAGMTVGLASDICIAKNTQDSGGTAVFMNAYMPS